MTEPGQPDWGRIRDWSRLPPEVAADLDGVQVAEAVWLAAHRYRPPVTAPPEAPAPVPSPPTPDDSGPAPADGGPAVAGVLGSPTAHEVYAVSAPARPLPPRWTVRAPAPLYADAGPPGHDGRRATPLRGPGAATGLDPATLRALAPLGRLARVPRREVLDVEATARTSADAGVTVPVLRRVGERWRELVLVIDDAPSMALWHRHADDLRQAVTRVGAFRRVSVVRFDGDRANPRLRGPAHTGERAEADFDVLTDPTGRRVFLIFTDGVGLAWRADALPRALRRWARHSPVAALDPLPRRLWHRSAVRAFRAHHPRGSGWRLPVWRLDADDVAAWARWVAGAEAEAASAVLGLNLPSPARPGEAEAAAPERIRRFRSTASADAVALAGRLAAVPLSLPTMRLVQRALLPGTGEDELAEVFLSGLLVRTGPRRPGEDPDAVVYDLRPGVRERLLATLSRTEALSAIDALAGVSDEVARLFGGTLNMRMLVEHDGGPQPLPAGARHFATIAVAVLSSLGPAHRRLAERINRQLVRRHPLRFQTLQGRPVDGAVTLTVVQVEGPARFDGHPTTAADVLADRIAADSEVHPDLIVACENLVADATAAEVARSVRFFERLRARLGLSRERLIMAPAPLGRHPWGRLEAARMAAGREATAVLAGALGLPRAPAGAGWQHRAVAGADLLVLDSTRADPAGGGLGEEQTRWLSATMAGPRPWPRIAVLHHDPATRLLDAARFRAIAADFDLVLHGWDISARAGGAGPAPGDPAAGFLVYRLADGAVAVRGRAVLARPVAAPVAAAPLALPWCPEDVGPTPLAARSEVRELYLAKSPAASLIEVAPELPTRDAATYQPL